jgi:hypothetical protein
MIIPLTPALFEIEPLTVSALPASMVSVDPAATDILLQIAGEETKEVT